MKKRSANEAAEDAPSSKQSKMEQLEVYMDGSAPLPSSLKLSKSTSLWLRWVAGGEKKVTEALELLKKFSGNIRGLQLYGQFTPEISASAAALLKLCSNLDSFDLSFGLSFDAVGLDMMFSALISSKVTLTSLSLGYSSIDLSIVCKHLKNFSKIKSLDATGVNMKDDELAALCDAVSSLPDLDQLALASNEFTNVAPLATLLRNKSTRLTCLILDQNKLNPEQAKVLAAALKENSSLR